MVRAGLALAASACLATATHAAVQPDIVFILVDDLGQ